MWNGPSERSRTDTNPRITVSALLLSPALPPAGPVLWAISTLFLQLPLLDIQQSLHGILGQFCRCNKTL